MMGGAVGEVLLAAVAFPILERIPLFGDAAVSPHGLGIAIGFLVGAKLLIDRAQKRGLGHHYVEDIPETVQGLLVKVAIGGIVGARLFYVLNHLDVYGSDPLRILMVWEGGLTFLGGVAGGILAVLPDLIRRGYRPMQALDSAAPGLAAGLAIGRLGDLVIGDHIGPPTEFVLGWRCTGNWWDRATNSIGYSPPQPYPYGAEDLPTQGCFDAVLHQTALYDFLATGIVFLLMLGFERSRRWDGFFVATWIYGYGGLRFLSDFAREDRRLFGLTGSQYAVLTAIVALSVWLLVRKPWERRPWAWDLEFDHPWLSPPEDPHALDDASSTGVAASDGPPAGDAERS